MWKSPRRSPRSSPSRKCEEGGPVVSEPIALQVARVYHSRKWAPLPVEYRGKAPHPNIALGWRTLRLAETELQKHFGRAPVNVGVILGEASHGLCDVDLDCRESIGLADVFLPATDSVFGRAGKPRSHRLYVVTGSHKTHQFKDLDGAMLVELRGEGGQTVFPGSLHESGEAIEWGVDGAVASVAHGALLRRVSVLAAACLLARHWPAEGSRNEAALALGGWLARAGWSATHVEVFVLSVARAANDEEADKRAASIRATIEKLSAGDETTGGVRLASLVGDLVVKKVAEWLEIKSDRNAHFGNKIPRRKPKRRVHVGEFVPFPVHLLPKPIRSFVQEFSASLGCDPAYLAVPVFGVLGAAIGNTRTVRLKVGWAEPAVIWSIVIAASGTLKSPALDAVLEPVHEFQLNGLKKHRDAVADYKRRMAAHKRDLKEFKQGRTEECPIEPEAPVIERSFCEDTTVEALAVVLSDALRGLLLCRDELSGWLKSFNQYRGGRGGDEAHWLAMHGARTLTVDRKTGDKPFIHVPRAALSIVGGIQPGVLALSLSQEHMHSGMAARMLFAYPPRRKKQWTDAEVSDWTKDDYKRVVHRLYELEPEESEGGVYVPVEIPLSPEAREAWIAFYNEHAVEQMAMTGATAAAWSKLEGYAARLALIVHCVRVAHGDKTCGDTVDLHSIEVGIALSRWFGAEALRVYAMLQVDEEDRDLHERLEVVRSLGGQVTVREWQRRRKIPSSDLADAELDDLVEAGLGTWSRAVPGATGGRPQKWFVANARDETTNGEAAEGDSYASPFAKDENELAGCGSVSSSTGHTQSDPEPNDPTPGSNAKRVQDSPDGDTYKSPGSAQREVVSSLEDHEYADSSEGEV